MRLEDIPVVVTGASGIARAGAERFAAEGARVDVISIDSSDCEAGRRRRGRWLGRRGLNGGW